MPDSPAAGVISTVRLAPLPPNVMFSVGTSVVSDELPVSVRSPAAVSTSPIVNGMSPVETPESVDWLPTSEIVGRSLTRVDDQVERSELSATMLVGNRDRNRTGATFVGYGIHVNASMSRPSQKG